MLKMSALCSTIHRHSIGSALEIGQAMMSQASSVLASNSLPSYLTSFVGREDDLHALISRIGDPATRLTTVTGPAGVGKTRLAVEALRAPATHRIRTAEELVFVDGAVIERGSDLVPAIASALGLEQSETESAEAISEFLADRQTLLLLDNLEHLTDGVGAIGGLLRACPGLRVLATSRMPLRLSGERLLALEPLALTPTEPGRWSPAALLFLERARMADRSFDETAVDPATVETVVRQIDGIPLAIELAAARLRILSLEALAALLTRQLTVLTDGPSDTAARHRTLQGAIDWSYNLLDPGSQAVMQRLGIFPEAFSLDAVESICLPETPTLQRRREALTIVSELFDQGLLQRVVGDGEASPRFRMLTSIREFARDRLMESDAYRSTVAAYLAYYVELVEAADRRMVTDDPIAPLDRLSREMTNIRQIVPLALELDDPEPALRAIGALWRYWEVRGPLVEARSLITQTFDRFDVRPEPHWGAALRAGGIVAELLADWDHATEWNRQAIAVWTELGDAGNLARSHIDLGNVCSSTGAFAEATEHYQAALELARATGNHRSELIALSAMGIVALREGEVATAAERFDAALPAFRAHRDPVMLGIHLSNYGVALGWLGRQEDATQVLEESLRIRREIGDEHGVANSLINIEEVRGRNALGGDYAREALDIGLRLDLPEVVGVANANLALGAFRQNDLPAAATRLIDALQLYASNPPTYVPEVLGVVAEVAAASDPADAAQLLGAANYIRAETGVPWSGHHAERIEEIERRLQLSLGEEAFSAATARGAGLDQQQAVLLALSVSRQIQRASPAPAAEPKGTGLGLTPRELTVLRLVATGRTDREIADELFISRKTASHHVTSILAKLECRNRAGATALAILMGIITQA